MTAWRFPLEPMLDPDRFFGRQQIVDEIRSLMTSGPSPDFVFVHGGQKIGRTSLLRQLHLQRARLLGSGVRTYFADLRVWSLMEPEDIVARFADGLRDVLHGPGSAPDGRPGPTLFEDMVDELSGACGLQLILLVDRGDKLVHAGLRRGVAELLGMLNDRLPNLGIVLSFGTGEELSSHHVLQRMEQLDDAVREISPVWARTTPRILGGLPRADSERYLATAGPLTTSDVAWIVELAGGHPFLLNRVGLTVGRSRAERSTGRLAEERRAAMEETLVRELLPMGHAILQRLRSDGHDRKLEDFAHELAAQRDPAPRSLRWERTEVEAVGILAGEGLVQVEEAGGAPVVRPLPEMEEGLVDVRYWMPSKLLRRVLRLARATEPGRPQRRPAGPRAGAAREGSPTVAVVVRDEPRLVATVPLTDIERRILQRLLRTPHGLLETGELARAVWGPPPDSSAADLWRERLRQRMIGLRRKLAPHVEGEPIINVYGKGYRLAAPERFSMPN